MSVLLHYSVWFKPNPTFELGDVDTVHADAGTAFKSDEFVSDCEQHGIKVTFAAPRHQEMNGICERAWANVRNIAFAFWSMHALVLNIIHLPWNKLGKCMPAFPSRILIKDDKPISPFEYFFDQKPGIRRFRVMFCPCVVNIGDGTLVMINTQVKF